MKTHTCDICGKPTREGINARAMVQLADKTRSVQLYITSAVDVDICDDCAVKAFDSRSLGSAQFKPTPMHQDTLKAENERMGRVLEFALNQMDFAARDIRRGVGKLLEEG